MIFQKGNSIPRASQTPSVRAQVIWTLPTVRSEKVPGGGSALRTGELVISPRNNVGKNSTSQKHYIYGLDWIDNGASTAKIQCIDCLG